MHTSYCLQAITLIPGSVDAHLVETIYTVQPSIEVYASGLISVNTRKLGDDFKHAFAYQVHTAY